MPVGTDKIKKGRKFAQVLAGARDVFLRDGFDGSSVDDIARVAGVSKSTLYSYFPDKRLLVTEVARAECCRQSVMATDRIDLTGPVDLVLHDMAGQIFDFVTSDFGARIYRICVAESNRFPDLGREFYDSGPLLVRDRIIAYFTSAQSRGELAIDDPEMAAAQFQELCRADVFPRLILNMIPCATAAMKARVVDNAVRTFLARYAAP